MRPTQLPLFEGASALGDTPAAGVPPGSPDAEARRFATDPRHHVVLQASAGTGKTSVLVDRYVRLLEAGVDPANILAITFTRKAAAEMRARVVAELGAAAARGSIGAGRWRDLRDRLPDIDITTIDAFCLSLLREFPLEAGLDPGFQMADETEVPRLVDEAIARALGIAKSLARADADVALLFARLKPGRLQEGLAHLVERRLVVPAALATTLGNVPADLTGETACDRALLRIADTIRAGPGGLADFIEHGPERARFRVIAADLARLDDLRRDGAAAVRASLERMRAYFLTNEGRARRRPPAPCSSRHRRAFERLGPVVEQAFTGLERDLHAVVARGLGRVFQIARREYQRALDARAVLDFPAVLERALGLVERMDDFSQSRYRLESRYQHLLVDEFQDTSRAQWELVALLVRSWREGEGVGHAGALPPSIFLVGDRKQSIYRFRDAEVTIFDEATAHIRSFGAGIDPAKWVSRSFRAVPELLSFVNDVCADVEKNRQRDDAFRFDQSDEFPIDPPGADDRRETAASPPVVGLVPGLEVDECARAVAAEIARLLAAGCVRDRVTGARRTPRPADFAVLFRSRESHREFDQALQALGIPAYVHRGLGFFDADEVKDVCALFAYLADPTSNRRAAALLRSRIVRISDPALATLAPEIARALLDGPDSHVLASLDAEDRQVLLHVRPALARWLSEVDRLPPIELVDGILAEAAYAYELAGPRLIQARENLKKLRSLIRRIQNRGYVTVRRLADHLDRLSAGDEANAIIEAIDAVNLMTVHAAKGLEFPVVFVVNLSRGAGGVTPAMRIVIEQASGRPALAVGPVVEDEGRIEADKEETKRLLYVALTRARDRLYLSANVTGGSVRKPPGSLADVLPMSLLEVLAAAATSLAGHVTEWISGRANRHRLVICRETDRPDADQAGTLSPVGGVERARTTLSGAPQAVGDQPAVGGDDFEPLTLEPTVTRTTVSALADAVSDAVGDQHPSGSGDALVGTLVHRLFQFAPEGDEGPNDVRARVETLVRQEELAGVAESGALLDEAVTVYSQMRSRPEVISLLAAGLRSYEVSFSWRPEPPLPGLPRGAIVRGTIDCLVRQPAGDLVVVEFKTGSPRPAHVRQLGLYVQAARALFPDTPVRGAVCYPHRSLRQTV